MSFDGKHVVVTGGTGALGTAVVDGLLGAGATCHLPAFDDAEVARFVHRDHPRVSLSAGIDLTDETKIQAFYAALPGLWASIHIAGGFAMAPVTDTAKADFVGQMNMNALTCFLSSREAIRVMRAGGAGGRVVNVAARPGIEPRQGAGMAAYTASKAAVAALTEALAEEVAGDGIWVNAVAPSILDTPANRAGMPDADHAAWPKVEEVAQTILHLASPANGAARGAIVPVYGRV